MQPGDPVRDRVDAVRVDGWSGSRECPLFSTGKLERPILKALHARCLQVTPKQGSTLVKLALLTSKPPYKDMSVVRL